MTVGARFYLFLLFFPLIAVADYQSGLDAYNAGFYANAMNDWEVVATAGPDTIHPAIYAETHYAIGMLYWQGQGVTKDYFEAIKWIQKAADLGHAGAQTKLGYLYSEGIAVQQDYEQAYQWFSKAAKKGDPDAQYNLDIFHQSGWNSEAPGGTPTHSRSALAHDMGSERIDHRPQADSYSKTWILRQNPEHYTIQVIALNSPGKLASLIEGYDHLAPFATYTVQRNENPIHVLIQGVYPSVESARSARDHFPRKINRPDRVWIRKFGKIQELISAENQDSGE